MEIKMLTDTISIAQVAGTAQLELPIETEMNLADYMPQVHKVIKGFVQPVILQKQIGAGRITLEGYLCCEVYYQSEENGALCQTEQKVPFTKHLDLKETQGYITGVNVFGTPVYLNVRALSSNRIFMRGSYGFTVQLCSMKEQEFLSQAEDVDVETQKETFNNVFLCAQQEKVISAEIPTQFSPAPKTILHVQTVCTACETQIIDNRLAVKGQLINDILYTDENDIIHTVQEQAPFQEVVAFEQINDNDIIWVDVFGFGCTVNAQEDTKENVSLGYMLSITGTMNVDVYRTKQTTTITDIFSVNDELKLDTVSVSADESIVIFDKPCAVQVSDVLESGNRQVVCAFAQALAPEMSETNEELQGKVVVCVFCKDENDEIDCFEKIVPYAVSLDDVGTVLRRSTANATQVSAEIQGETLVANVQLTVKAVIAKPVQLLLSDKINVVQPVEKTPDDVAMYIYYANAKDTAFDVAKRYHVHSSEINCITRENGNDIWFIQTQKG